MRVISDFLPSPEELALKDETVKVTIALSKTSVDFFKNNGSLTPPGELAIVPQKMTHVGSE